MKNEFLKEGLFCLTLVGVSGYLLYRIILYVMLAVILAGCGTKKKAVERSQEKTIEIVNKDIVRKTENNVTTNAFVDRKIGKTVIKPIDVDKKSSYNGTEFQNAVIEEIVTDEKIAENKVDKTVQLDIDKTYEKKEEKLISVDKDVDIDRSWNVFDWLWLFIAVAIVIVAIRLYVKKINPIKALISLIKKP